MPEGVEHEISVVVPIYNEAENLVPLTSRLVQVLGVLGKPYEILLVNDGSTDGSSRVLQDLATKHPEVRIIHFRRNAGQTAALHAGFKRARGAVVVTLDGDLQNDPHDIPSLLEALTDYDVVCGIRQRRQDTWLRRISSHIANGIRRLILHDDIIDIGCSLRAYKRHCLAPLTLYHGMHRFLPVLLHLEGFRIGQVPVSHHPRTFGTSKYNMRNRAWRALVDLLAVRWMQRRHLRYEVIEEAREREQGR